MLTKDTLSKLLFLLSFFYFLSGVSAQAQVYKCVDSDGKTLYSNAPCPENTEEQSYKLKESYTINEDKEIIDEIPPGVVNDDEPVDDVFKSDSL
ncbi:MAG: DUF4124 domain-containing protein, partial [Candidatus Dadabacteria bacterium]|nr:DUF4124 domain-containing protein [Candidatus Dadabacteria bacterium]NIV41216.1 DUF4124 domain-containing protein [Candidatus Dadabacteria bacterium]NIX15093.1 DUF4124 domain-containing protein [Candidatus Dadabacteria bacterium]